MNCIACVFILSFCLFPQPNVDTPSVVCLAENNQFTIYLKTVPHKKHFLQTFNSLINKKTTHKEKGQNKRLAQHCSSLLILQNYKNYLTKLQNNVSSTVNIEQAQKILTKMKSIEMLAPRCFQVTSSKMLLNKKIKLEHQVNSMSVNLNKNEIANLDKNEIANSFLIGGYIFLGLSGVALLSSAGVFIYFLISETIHFFGSIISGKYSGSSSPELGIISLSLFVGSMITLFTGVVFMAYGYSLRQNPNTVIKSNQENQTRTSIQMNIAPWFDGQNVGLSIVGRF